MLELVGDARLLLDIPSRSASLYTTLLWTGEEYLFVWRLFGGDGVFMQRIDASGQTLGGNMRLMTYENAVDLAWGGGRLAAVWTREVPVQESISSFQTFDCLARPLGDAVTLRSSARISVDGSVVYGPRIAAIAAGFAIVWNEGRRCWSRRSALDGRLRQGPAQMDGDDLDGDVYVSVAAAGNRVLVGWSGRPPLSRPAVPPPTITATRAFSDRLIALGTALTRRHEHLRREHQVLAAGSGFLALWTRDFAVGTQVSHRPARRRRRPDRAAATLARPVGGAYRDLAPAAWNGDHLVVLWDRSTTNQKRPDADALRGRRRRARPPSAAHDVTRRAGLYLAARDGKIGLSASSGPKIAGAYEVYFRAGEGLP